MYFYVHKKMMTEIFFSNCRNISSSEAIWLNFSLLCFFPGDSVSEMRDDKQRRSWIWARKWIHHSQQQQRYFRNQLWTLEQSTVHEFLLQKDDFTLDDPSLSMLRGVNLNSSLLLWAQFQTLDIVFCILVHFSHNSEVILSEHVKKTSIIKIL